MMKTIAVLALSLMAVPAFGLTEARAQTKNPPAPAQTPPPTAAPVPEAATRPEQGSNWRVDCSNDGKALNCQAIFQVTQRETNQLIAAVSIRIAADTKKPVALVQLPLGIQVSEPVTLRIDELAPEKFSIQTCTQSGCLAGGPLADTMLAAMRTGKELKLAFSNLNKQTVTVTMGLVGFGLAYDKIK